MTKQVSSYRLNQDVIDYLRQRDSASAYLERLVRNDMGKPAGSAFIKQDELTVTVDDIVDEVRELRLLLKTTLELITKPQSRGTSETVGWEDLT